MIIIRYINFLLHHSLLTISFINRMNEIMNDNNVFSNHLISNDTQMENIGKTRKKNYHRLITLTIMFIMLRSIIT